MTPQEFATKIRTKYPNGVASDGRKYADIPDNELSQKIIAKYPEYSSQVKLTPEVSNTIEQRKQPLTTRVSESLDKGVTAFEKADLRQSTGQQTGIETAIQKFGTGLKTAGDVAFETARSLPVLGTLIDKTTGALTQNAQAYIQADPTRKAQVESAVQTYNSLDERTKANLGALFEITSAIAGGGASKAGVKVGEKALISGAEVVGSTVAGAGRATKGIGEVAVQSAITPTVKEAERILSYQARKPFITRVSETITGDTTRPLTRAQTAVEKGLMGTEKQIAVQARRTNQKLWQEEIAPAIDSSTAVVTKNDLFEPIIARIEATAEPGRKQALRDAFEAIAEDYKDISTLSLKQAQEIKQGLDEFTPDKVFKGKSVANEYATLKNDMANAIRSKTYDALSDVNIKKKYLDWANLKELEKIGVKALTQGGTKGGFGGFWSTIWDKATIPVKTIGGRILYRVGNSFEFIGEKGIKKFGDYLSGKGITK